jgi:ankyrin repeat protein
LEITSININHVNKNGDNTYLVACKQGHLEIMKHLETTSINIHHVNNVGNNVISIARYNQTMEILEHLIYLFRNKYKYNNTEQTECLICYLYDNKDYITCKNNHVVHHSCQIKSNNEYCLFCFVKYENILLNDDDIISDDDMISSESEED